MVLQKQYRLIIKKKKQKQIQSCSCGGTVIFVLGISKYEVIENENPNDEFSLGRWCMYNLINMFYKHKKWDGILSYLRFAFAFYGKLHIIYERAYTSKVTDE